MIAIAVYYFWTLRLGARASAVDRTGFATVGFVFYELLGILGLGPSRFALRQTGVQALTAYIPAVSIGVLVALSLCVVGAAELRKRATRRDFIFFGIAVGLPFALVIGGAELTHVRILGRHCMPLLPFVLALQAIGLRHLLFGKSVWFRVAAVTAAVVMLISALEIRIAPRHRRDDYRTAAAETRRAIANGKKVWWVADETAGTYYNVPLNSNYLLDVGTLTRIDLEKLEQPDLIVFSKPDIYDPAGNVEVYLLRHDFRAKHVLPAFQIFER